MTSRLELLYLKIKRYFKLLTMDDHIISIHTIITQKTFKKIVKRIIMYVLTQTKPLKPWMDSFFDRFLIYSNTKKGSSSSFRFISYLLKNNTQDVICVDK